MKTILKNIKLSVFFSFLFLNLAFAQNLPFHDGDIVGESEISHSPTTAFFEAATASRYGHVAVVLKVKNNWVVYEETPPQARVTSLETFLNASPGPYTVIRSKKPLLAQQLAKIKATAQDLVNKKIPYNHSQTRHEGYLNCSEFANLVFASAGVSVGQVQKISDMNLGTFHGYPWQLWQKIHPETRLDDQVITPASVMRSAGWKPVAGPLNPYKLYSDLELVQNWKTEKGFDGVAALWRLTPEQLEKLAQP